MTLPATAHFFEGEVIASARTLLSAVCLRDRLADLTAQQRKWCIAELCQAVNRGASDWQSPRRARHPPLDDAATAAITLPLLWGWSLSEGENDQWREAFIKAITHANDDVRTFAAIGVANHVAGRDAAFALRCAQAMALEIQEQRAEWH
jgi:hypothetical protein